MTENCKWTIGVSLFVVPAAVVLILACGGCITTEGERAFREAATTMISARTDIARARADVDYTATNLVLFMWDVDKALWNTVLVVTQQVVNVADRLKAESLQRELDTTRATNGWLKVVTGLTTLLAVIGFCIRKNARDILRWVFTRKPTDEESEGAE